VASNSSHQTPRCFEWVPGLERAVKGLIFTSVAGVNTSAATRTAAASTALSTLPRGSQRRYLFQCTNKYMSGSGFKWSYPDATWSKAPTNHHDFEGQGTSHGDLPLLASLAEAAGVDLRVVALTRQPFASTALSRQTTSAPFEARVREMRDMECVLAAQLRSISPEFYHVLEYDELLSHPESTAAALARFLGTNETELAASFRRGLVPSTRQPSKAQIAYARGMRTPACALPGALRSIMWS